MLLVVSGTASLDAVGNKLGALLNRATIAGWELLILICQNTVETFQDNSRFPLIAQGSLRLSKKLYSSLVCTW